MFVKQHPYRVNRQVLAYKRGDVTGDGVSDFVYLTGRRLDPQSPFIQQIQLHIRDGITDRVFVITPQENAGYNPTLFLGDFTGDRIDDIFINIDSGGSGGFTYNYLYSLAFNIPRLLYSNEWFNEFYNRFEVTYQNHYKVKVEDLTLKNVYILDISHRGDEYLSELYKPNGKLIKPTEGSVLGVNTVYPIDREHDGIFELWVWQRIIGLYGADTLGYVQTQLQWDRRQKRFLPAGQLAAVFGTESA